MSRIFKIVSEAIWREALASGSFAGAGVDLADGFIHFSAAGQIRETASRYFRDQQGLVVLEVESGDLGQDLKWERSRGGQLFPHLYGPLSCALVIAVHDAPLGVDGAPSLAWLAS